MPDSTHQTTPNASVHRALREALDSFTGMREGGSQGPIHRYRACVTPAEYENWQAAAAGLTAWATPPPGCDTPSSTDRATLLREAAEDERPLSLDYEHPECGFHWHGRDGMDIPMRDGQPVCPRCELAKVEKKLAYVQRMRDEVGEECKRRGRIKLEQAERIIRLERELDGVRDQLGKEMLRADDAEAELRRVAAETQSDDDSNGALIEDYLRFLRGQGPEPDLSDLPPSQRQAITGHFEIVKALTDRDRELPPLDRDPVALRLGLHAPAAEEQPAETPMFGSPDCTCIPFTRQDGRLRYCGPTDTVDMISGWERRSDCPHHRPAVGEQPDTQTREALTLPPPEGPEYTPCICDHIEPEHAPDNGRCRALRCGCPAYRPTPPAPLRRSEDDCPGFPESCPNLRPVDPQPPVHLGGIRCGCADPAP